MNPWRIIGLLSGLVGLGAAELVAGWTGPDSSPLFAVGDAVVDLTPRPVKDLAITLLGPADKVVLLGSILVVVTGAAVAVGKVAERSLVRALLGVVLLGAVAAIAAVTRPDASASDLAPSLFGTAVAAVALVGLARAASRIPVAGHEGASAEVTPRPAGVETGTTPLDRPVHDEALADTTTDARVSTYGETVGARRSFLIAGATVGVLGVGSAVLGRWLSYDRFGAARSRRAVVVPRPDSPAAGLPRDPSTDIPGLSRFQTPNGGFYRVDTALTVPQVAAEDWELRIHGMVRRPLTLTYRDLVSRPMIERDITLACVSNPVGGPYVGNARWIGVPLKGLLAQVGVDAAADQVVSRSHDGMTIGTPTAALTDGRDAMLAVAMNGEPLPLEHGFPVRMVVPGLYGYVSACKWIVEMELTRFDRYDAYWIKQGWAEQAEVKTASRIDTPHDGGQRKPGIVTVAGVAWAQHRGIERVEIQVDDGEWQTAELAEPSTIDTWRQWLYRWRAEPGEHTLRVRATDRDGNRQPSNEQKPFPDGATGWHQVQVTVEE
ncbi:MAG: molybdopterin-dependent oxidoreductase [Micromonosporaceae bacterium]